MRTTISKDKGAWQCWLSIVAAMWVIATPVEACADPPHYRIDFTAPKHLPHCNDPDGFRGVLALALSRDVLESPASRVLDVRLDKPHGGDYVVDIAVKELDGKVITTLRETHPRSTECFKVLHSAALTAALEIDKSLPPVEEPSSRPEAPPPPPPCPVCEEPRPNPRKQTSIDRRWFVGLGGFASLNAAPATVVGLQLAGGRRLAPSWSIELDGRWAFPTVAYVDHVLPVRVLSVVSAAAAPCWRRGAFGVCGVISFSNMWFEVSQIDQPPTGTAQDAGFGVRGFIEHRLSERWSVRFDAELIGRLSISPMDDDVPELRWPSIPLVGNASATLFLWP